MGGGGHFGLYLDAALEWGSSHTSETYANPPLAGSLEFRCVKVEAWGFHGHGFVT